MRDDDYDDFILSEPIMNDPRYETTQRQPLDLIPGELIRRNTIRGRITSKPTEVGAHVQFRVEIATGIVTITVPRGGTVDVIRRRPDHPMKSRLELVH